MAVRALRFAFLALCVAFVALGVASLVYGAILLIAPDPDGSGGPRTVIGGAAALVGLLVVGYAVFAIRMTRP